jgi:hypothetical protein
MFGKLSKVLGRQERVPDPLVKVAGLPARRDAETCLEALEAKGISAVLKEEDDRPGAYELWVRASQEPQARLVMGLSGRSVIRLERPASAGGAGGRTA